MGPAKTLNTSISLQQKKFPTKKVRSTKQNDSNPLILSSMPKNMLNRQTHSMTRFQQVNSESQQYISRHVQQQRQVENVEQNHFRGNQRSHSVTD